jgi:acylphosphatase
MSDSDQTVRWTVLFSGTVQGVGFRYTTERVARRFDVAGYVRNLPDGRVELVAEGTKAELARLIEAVEEAMGGYIRDTDRSESPARGGFAGFDIRF